MLFVLKVSVRDWLLNVDLANGRWEKSQSVKMAVLFIGSDMCLYYSCAYLVFIFQILLSVIEKLPITC